jgi:fluoroacetyl-CoA thioesterase
MEKTARQTVESKLPEGQITVGTRVDIRHLRPVPIGENLKVTAQLVGIDKTDIQSESRMAKLSHRHRTA